MYWPGMKDDIVRRCLQCKVCLGDAPKQRKEQLLSHHIPVQPWTKVGVDLFESRKQQFVVVVDYTSDYFEYVKLHSQQAADIIDILKELFSRLGIPKLVHTDNAAYFTASEFASFSKRWKFQHSTSSPHYHQSNGKVEAAVKISKRILRRCADPYMALLEYCNTPSEGMTTSPVQRLLGRSTRTMLPGLGTISKQSQENHQEKLEKQRKIKKQYDRSARDLPVLKEGDPVMVKDYHNHKREWREARVSKQLSGRSYAVEADGELLRRNRRDLRPSSMEQLTEQNPASPSTSNGELIPSGPQILPVSAALNPTPVEP